MKALLAISLGALALASVSASALSAEPYGTWKVGKGKVTIEIVDCGGDLCANIVGLAEPNRNGQPKVDRHNKIAALRDRPLMGLQIATGLRKVAEGRWEGKIYNADDGNIYAAKVSVVDESIMKLKGCVFGGLICQSSKLYRQ